MRATGFMQYGKNDASQTVTAEDVARQLLSVAVNVKVNNASGANPTLGARACGGEDVVRISSECTSSERCPAAT